MFGAGKEDALSDREHFETAGQILSRYFRRHSAGSQGDEERSIRMRVGAPHCAPSRIALAASMVAMHGTLLAGHRPWGARADALGRRDRPGVEHYWCSSEDPELYSKPPGREPRNTMAEKSHRQHSA